MRIALVTLFVCVFVVMTTVDKFACPDGCTDEIPVQTASQHTTSSCGICQGWSPVGVVIALRPAPLAMARDTIAVSSPTDPAIAIDELPPKAA